MTALCLVTFFAGLGRSAIGDADEAFYAQSAREMIDSGDWITPHYNYELRFQKPVFFYWLVAIAYSVAGVNETAARFPSALAGLALALMTWAIARRWIDARTGVVAGAIVATSFGYFAIARASLPDLPLAAFITLATWALFEASLTQDAKGHRRWLIVAGIAFGLGVLTKGPVALVLPVLVYLAAWTVVGDGLAPTKQGWFGLRWIDVVLATAVILVIAVPWFIAMADVHGLAYLHRFFVGENFERFASERYNGRRPLWFYGPIILGGLAPWSSLMLLWLPSLRKIAHGERRLTDVEWRLVLWAVLPVLFYTLSVGQQPRYILPVLPPLAILVARTLVTRLDAAEAAGRRHLGIALAATASALAFLAFAFLLLRARPLLFALSPLAGHVGAVAIITAGVVLLGISWFGRPRWLPAAIASAAAVTLVSLQFCVYSAAGLEPVQQMARHVTAVRKNEPSGTYRVFVRNLVFYTGVKQTDLANEEEAIEYLRQPQRVLCVMPLGAFERFQQVHGLPLQRLASVVYFNPSAVRLRTLLKPNPERSLETVVLVANQP